VPKWWIRISAPFTVRMLIRDHHRKFTPIFDAVFEGAGSRIVRTPIRFPQANGIAARFVRTVRAECLDWLLILNAAAPPARAVLVHRSLQSAPTAPGVGPVAAGRRIANREAIRLADGRR